MTFSENPKLTNTVLSFANIQFSGLILSLKGSFSWHFLPLFFHDLNPSGSLIHTLKYFRIIFRFRPSIQMFKKLCSVHHTGESNSAVCIIIISGGRLWGVQCINNAAESDSAVCTHSILVESRKHTETRQCMYIHPRSHYLSSYQGSVLIQ